MTILSSASKVIIGGNGVQTAFNYTFYVPGSTASDQTNFQITTTDNLGNQTVLSNSQYVVSNNYQFGATPGGTLTYNPLSGPLPTGWTITIARILPYTQAVSISNQGNFYPQITESMGDVLCMEIQQISEQYNRTLQAPISDVSAPSPLPASAARANKVLGFDNSGNPVAVSSLPAGTVSSAMQPVINSSTIALARTALGLGAAALEGIGAGLQDDGSGNLRVDFATTTAAGATSITSSSHLKQYIVGAGSTFSLAKASTLWSGFGFFVFGAGYATTLSPNSADSVQGGSSGTSYTIPANAQAWVTTDSVNGWYVLITPVIAPTNTVVALPGVQGLSITNNSGTPNTEITVTIAQAVVTNSSGLAVFYSGGTLTINLGTTGANALYTGSIAASTWYFIYIIYNPATATFAGLASTSATSPTLPSGYTYSYRIGAMQTDGSSHLYRTLQKGKEAQYVITAATNTATWPFGTNSIQASATALQVTGNGFALPTTATRIFGNGSNFSIISNWSVGSNATNAAQTNTLDMVGISTPSSSTAGALMWNFLLESNSIYYINGSASIHINVIGWFDSVNAC
ncbi:MAG: hypothetical protein WBX25_29970 [Rhodomicrobium sp.]